MRDSSEGQQWDLKSKKLYPSTRVDVFDGKLFKSFTNPSSGWSHYGQGIVKKADKSPSVMSFPILPVFMGLRGADPKFFKGLNQFQIVDNYVAIDGRPCVRLKKPRDAQNAEFLCLDRERGYVVVQMTICQDGITTWQLDVDNSAHPTLGWLPQSGHTAFGPARVSESWSRVMPPSRNSN